MYDVNVEIDEENPNYIIENKILYNKNKDTIITVLKQIDGKFEVPDGVKKIEGRAFSYQSKLTEINLNKVTEISSLIFNGCTELKTIEVPNTIEKIDTNAFSEATSLSRIIIHKKENAISGSPFGSPFGLRAIEWVGNN